MSETETAFKVTPIEKKPSRSYRKGSKYDAMLDAFIKANIPLAKIEAEGKTANYLNTNLRKRIDARELKGISVSTTNGECYLENANVKKVEKAEKKTA